MSAAPHQLPEWLACPGLWAARDVPFLPWGAGARELEAYLQMLLAWNRRLNLSGCHDAGTLMRDLIQDSFFLAVFLEKLRIQNRWNQPLILDLGAGAGLPGIPLRIFWRNGQYAMIERRQKRALFLANALARLKLADTTAHCGDAELLARKLAPAQCVLSRAFMPWREMLSFCRPFLAEDGLAVFMANEPVPEMDNGWKVNASFEYFLPAKRRFLWAIAKRHAA